MDTDNANRPPLMDLSWVSKMFSRLSILSWQYHVRWLAAQTCLRSRQHTFWPGVASSHRSRAQNLKEADKKLAEDARLKKLVQREPVAQPQAPTELKRRDVSAMSNFTMPSRSYF